jgi:hypothetical protein
MDKIELARKIFTELESCKNNIYENARRNFEIQSRLTSN